jgi:signal transduction histidine kinase
MGFVSIIKTFYNKVKPFGENIHALDERRIFVFSFPVIVMLFLYSILTYFVVKRPVLAYWEIGCALLALSTNLIYRKTKNYQLSANILVFSGLLILSVIAFYTGGVEGSVLFWISICPLCAGMIIDKRAILIWGGICVGVIAGFMVFNDFIQNYPTAIKNPDLLLSFRYRTLFGTTIFSMLMSFIYKSLVELAVHRAEAQQTHVKNLLRLVTHDIGNPLALIDMTSRIIQKDIVDQVKKEYLWKKQKLGIKTIVDILNQVREMEAIESGKRNIELAKVNLFKVVQNSFFIFEDQLHKKDLTLTINNQVGEDLKVIAEAISLSNQVLNNLISNAIKFSKRGGEIFINLYLVGEYCVVEVKDSGVGIDDDTLKIIFDASEKTSHMGTEGEKGTGFGMPLMKVFVEKFEGKIEIDGRTEEKYPNDHGTTIKIYLKKVTEDASDIKIAG